jgi:hypothetical protein
MKGKTSREKDDLNPQSKDGEGPEPTYKVHYPVSYDIGSPYTVVVD